MSKKVILFSLLFILILLPSISAWTCFNTDVNEYSNKIVCKYVSSSYDVFNPKVFNNDSLVYTYSNISMPMRPNTIYSIIINVDVYKSRLGEHKLTLIQNNEKFYQTINVNRLTSDFKYDLNISYPEFNKTISAKLTLTNNTNKNLATILELENIPNNLETNLQKQIIILKANETKEIPFKIEYSNSDYTNLNYKLIYSNKMITIPISLEKDKMPLITETNNATAFFTLASASSNTILIVLDTILFILAIVLFTMFVGRLGKYIVRK